MTKYIDYFKEQYMHSGTECRGLLF